MYTAFSKEQEAFEKLAKKELTEIPERVFSDKNQVNPQIENTVYAARQGAKIIVWNEISLILNQIQTDTIISTIKEIAKEYNTYILAAFLEQNNTSDPKPFNNNSILIKPDGTIGWEYRKSALHPDAEAPIINPGDFKIPFLDTEYGRLGSVICYDMEFPKYIRQAGKQSIDIMLVPAYDWETITPLHAQMASFEAIQNGFSLVRPNGKGLSAVFDNYGNIIAKLTTYESNSKILIADLPVKSVVTVYSKTGNVFVLLCLLFMLLVISLRLAKKI